MRLDGADRPLAPFGTREVAVTGRSELGPYVALTVLDTAGPVPAAGQFYMLRSVSRWGGGEDGRPYLPRALSFARCESTDSGHALDFLFEVVGPGTERLGELLAGDGLVLTGPFGNGFALDPSRHPILVAGGIGLAPIVALKDEILAETDLLPDGFVGFASAAHVAAVDHYWSDEAQPIVATDDGSAGRQGFVTQFVAESLDVGRAAVYACGPPAMLEAVRSLCAEQDVPAQLALESGMACGFGACYGCVVPTKDGFLRLCVDGPVLDAARLESAVVAGAGH